MAYHSVVEEIWSRLAVQGSAHHPTTMREDFHNVCEAFYQAEHCLFSEKSSIHVKMYRAEWNIHVYYFGENSSFLGLDPAVVAANPSVQLEASEPENSSASPAMNFGIPSISSTIVSPEIASNPSAPPASSDNPRGSITPEEALANKQLLEHRLASCNRHQQPHHVQLGWNPATGEPWFAVRSYAVNAYLAIWGRERSALENVAAMAPEIVLQFQRFPYLGYVLIWPELAHPRSVSDDEVWNHFHQFRQFLDESTSGLIRGGMWR